jgi:hypothetical protein
MANPPGHGLLIIERILRDRDGIWRQVIEERDLRPLTLQMLASSAVSLAIFGLVLGASSSLVQALSSAVKLTLLFVITLAICLPTLYLFNLVFGARLSVMQAVTLIMTSITVIAVIALAFAPISLFFLITAPDSYAFYKLLNVAILVLAAVVGLRFLTSGMRALSEHQEEIARLEAEAVRAAELAAAGNGAAPDEGAKVLLAIGAGADPSGAEAGESTGDSVAAPANGGTVAAAAPATGRTAVVVHPLTQLAQSQRVGGPSDRPPSMSLLYVWIVLFGFVGTQLSWTLRPIFGDPGQPFALFRDIEGTFYNDILRTIGQLFGG